MIEVRVLSNWNSKNYERQTPLSNGQWNNINYNFSPINSSHSTCDVCIVLNYLHEAQQIQCSPNNVWALMQEPYISGFHEFMKDCPDNYAKVFTHLITGDKREIRSQPALPWHINKNYSELKKSDVPTKNKLVSCIASKKILFKGHRDRTYFVNYLMKNKNLDIDFYGKGFNYVPDKYEALAPYYFSVAIENVSKRDYWTEKIADCFLSYTIPIYYGCTNISDYFPKDSYIWINPADKHKTSEIFDSLSPDVWEKRFQALIKARNMILDEYQFFPHMEKIIRKYYEEGDKEIITINKYRPDHYKKVKIIKELI